MDDTDAAGGTGGTDGTGTRGEVAGLLLAAGGGRRLGGRPKALLDFRGRPLVEHAARVLRAGGCARVYVVLGAAAGLVRARAVLPGCVLVDNPRWAEGMSTSLRAGLAALEPAEGPVAEAVVVALVDQPGVTAEAVARVVAAARAGGDLASGLVAASYGGRRGHPVLFGAARWGAVAAGATGDRGARGYLLEHAARTAVVECADVADPADVDTPDDLSLLLGPEARGGPGSGPTTADR
ncbi:nucleotidyltransferase family protein [Actinacidiphila yeochonensis]|uniref:nucleotidyltransferase family protein n=1 Tax=Actinacidiphila yeochonensis TaxID=89050 RepID=UPI00068D204A|nr:nucleotidyltransferase family protein [Actinacidiphila yeochonensis]